MTVTAETGCGVRFVAPWSPLLGSKDHDVAFRLTLMTCSGIHLQPDCRAPRERRGLSIHYYRFL